MKNNHCIRHYIAAGVYLVLFLILLVCVLRVDVAPIGPMGTSVGLSGANEYFHEKNGVRMGLYELTQWLGYLALAIAAGFGCFGLAQLIRRKNLWKVDREILVLGVLYIVLGGLYVLFEKFVVNYRPVLLPGETAPAASFPSSHTMLALAIFGSAALLSARYVKQRTARTVLYFLCSALGIGTVVLRLLSGVHWLTDIVAGVSLGTGLVELYTAVSGLHNYKGPDK